MGLLLLWGELTLPQQQSRTRQPGAGYKYLVGPPKGRRLHRVGAESFDKSAH